MKLVTGDMAKENHTKGGVNIAPFATNYVDITFE
jgi:hypothetical protein